MCGEGSKTEKAEKTAQLCMVTKSLDILPASLVSGTGLCLPVKSERSLVPGI